MDYNKSLSEYRDIDWGVNFSITINGEEASWDDLSDNEREKILEDIKEDYVYGNFLGNEIEEEY